MPPSANQARQVRAGEPRGAGRAERSRNRGAGARQIKIAARELLRAQEFERRYRRRHRCARRFDASARWLPHGDGTQRRAQGEPEARPTSIRARPISSPRIRDPERIKKCPAKCAPVRRGRQHRRTRPQDYLASIDGPGLREDSERRFVPPRFLHPKLGFTFVAPEGFSLDNTARRCSGQDAAAGLAPRRRAGAGGADLAEYLNSGWIENIDQKTSRRSSSTAPCHTLSPRAIQWVFRSILRFAATSIAHLRPKRMGPEIDRLIAKRCRRSAA